MELLPSNRRPENSGALATTDKRALAIRQQYGDIGQLCQKFNINAQRYCALNVEKAIRGGVPSFALIVRTYGEDGIAALIGGHITDAILRMGEDQAVDEYDVDFIARAICESERFRLLSMASILRFFHLLKCGEFDIYGKVTPRKILEAFRKYAVEQQAKENRIAYEIEKEKAAAEEAEHAKQRVTWEDWATKNGIDPAGGFQGWLKKQAEEARKEREEAERKKKPIWEAFAEAVNTLVSVISFVAEYNQIKSKNK